MVGTQRHRRLLSMMVVAAFVLVALLGVAPPGAAAAAPPSAPQAVVAHGNGIGVARVTWDAPANPGTSAITQYTVTASPGGRTQQLGAAGCLEGPDPPLLEAEFSGLDPNQRYVFAVAAHNADGAGASASTPGVLPRPQVGNLVLNTSFETSLNYWSGFRAAIARVAQAGAPDGRFVARVSRASGTSYTIGDAASAGTLPTVIGAGGRHIAIAAVRAASGSSVGKPVSVVLRERTPAGATVRTTRGTVKPLTNGWQHVSVEASALRAGNTMGVAVGQTAAGPGNSMFVDSVRLYSTSGLIMGDGPAAPRGATPAGIDPNIKRAITTETGEWSPNGPADCYLVYPQAYEITSLRAYVDGRGGGAGSQPIRGILYDADGRLMASTQAVTIAAGRAAGWVTLPFTTPVKELAMGGVKYMLGIHAGGSSKVTRIYGHPGGGTVFATDAFTDGAAATFGPARPGTLSTYLYAYGGF